MRAMVMTRVESLALTAAPLKLQELALPGPADDEVLIRVMACGVCRTDLDEIEGRTAPSVLPRVLGHQIVGRIDACGSAVTGLASGSRVGVSWLGRTCGACRFCQSGRENLCASFVATGRDIDGGYADYVVAAANSVVTISTGFSDVEAAPLLCGGAIGYRSLALAELSDGEALGLTGFGASAHLVLQLARQQYPASPVFVFARDEADRRFARELGAAWAGDIDEAPPAVLSAIIDTTPAWRPIVRALRHLDRGGRLVINAIRKDDRDKQELTAIDYARDLWLEKTVVSVANVTRADVRAFLEIAMRTSIRPVVTVYPLERANEALQALRSGGQRGAIVLQVGN